MGNNTEQSTPESKQFWGFVHVCAKHWRIAGAYFGAFVTS